MADLIHERLPSELRLKVLQSLPDFNSLHSCILASRSFFEIYRQNQLHVQTAVLDNYIPRLLQPDAALLNSVKYGGSRQSSQDNLGGIERLNIARKHASTLEWVCIHTLFNVPVSPSSNGVVNQIYPFAWTQQLCAFLDCLRVRRSPL